MANSRSRYKALRGILSQCVRLLKETVGEKDKRGKGKEIKRAKNRKERWIRRKEGRSRSRRKESANKSGRGERGNEQENRQNRIKKCEADCDNGRFT